MHQSGGPHYHFQYFFLFRYVFESSTVHPNLLPMVLTCREMPFRLFLNLIHEFLIHILMYNPDH